MSMTPRRRKMDQWPHRIWANIRRVFALVGFMMLLSFVMIAVNLHKLSAGAQVKLHDNMVLAYAIDGDLSEESAPPSLLRPNLLGGDTLHDVTRALDAAANDTRVKGVVVRLDAMKLSMAQVQELRGAVTRFRQAKKFAWIQANDYGGQGAGGGAAYYLASAFGRIWLQPVGSVALTGVALQIPFFKTLMDKVGLQADMIHKGRYKSAPESVTNTTLSADSRENLESLLGNLSGQMKDDIALARGLSAQQMDDVMAAGLFTDRQAIDRRLVDNLGYADEMITDAKKEAGADPKKGMVPLMAYLAARDDAAEDERGHGFFAQLKSAETKPERDDNGDVRRNPAGRTIALITATGEIVDDTTPDGMSAGRITPAGMRRAFAEATRDADVQAIVLRMDSPGGSASASESIRRLIVQARAKNIPVVVSMSGTAASGGYWISSAADRIVAQPATLTGSIGVFGGKIVIADAMQKVGVNIETLKSAPRADLWTATHAFQPDERALVDGLMQSTYDGFLDRVAEGRHLDRAKVAGLAEGRVYTGQQAKQLGLVDTLGGLDVAVREAQALAKIGPDEKVDVVDYPASRGPLGKLIALLTGEQAVMPLSAALALEADALLQQQARAPMLLAPVPDLR